MSQQTYAQRVVVEMLFAFVHVAVVNESLLEGIVQRGGDSFKLGVVGLLSQQLGIVGYVEEGVDEFVFKLIDRIDAIDTFGGTVDGFLLCGIECQKMVAQLLGSIDDRARTCLCESTCSRRWRNHY